MKVRMFFGALILVGATAVVTQVVSQDGEGSAAQQKAEQEMMAKWMEFMTPGEPHQYLMQSVGDWTSVSEMWMVPGQPSMPTTGRGTIKSIMDGRYVVEEVDGEGMGMQWQGMGVRGYDNLKKKFIAVWLDSMGTGVMVMEGRQSGGVINYRGMGPDVMTGEYVPMRFVEKMIDKDNYEFEMFGPGPDGKEFRTMRMHYTRVSMKKTK